MAWDIKNKTVLITGATDGIGKATALELARRGAVLALVSRDEAQGRRAVEELRGKSGNERVELLVCDLAKLSSVAACAKEYLRRFGELHVCIHAAGVMAPQTETHEGIERTIAVNYFAPVLLTELLLPCMKKSAPARLIMVASSMHKYGAVSLSNLEGQGLYDGTQAYSNSKLALMLYALHLSRALSPREIAVAAVHPGWIRTKLATAMGTDLTLKQKAAQLLHMRPPSWGAESIVHLATAPDVSVLHGAYVIKKLPEEPHPIARDAKLAEELFARTQTLLWRYLA